MANACDLSIVIPVFNEAENLSGLLGKVRALGLSDAKIIVVDDGSTDRNADMAVKAGVNVIRHPYNISNGAAIKNGIRAARGRLILFIDGDGQHQPDDIPKPIAESANYRRVVGARAAGSKLRFHR